MKKYLALDVGGTKTHIALFSVNETGEITFTREKKNSTQGAQNIEEIVLDFNPDMKGVEGICLAIAGLSHKPRRIAHFQKFPARNADRNSPHNGHRRKPTKRSRAVRSSVSDSNWLVTFPISSGTFRG